MMLNEMFEDVSHTSELLGVIEESFNTYCQIIGKKFPNLSCKNASTNAYPQIRLVNRPLDAGLGWTQHSTKCYKLGDVLISENIDLLPNDIHFNSVIAHEAAHVAAYNWIFQDKAEFGNRMQEWKDCDGHTKIWHKIVNHFNNNLHLKNGEKAFDIVEKIEGGALKRYFPND